MIPEPYLTLARYAHTIGGVLTVRYVLHRPEWPEKVTLGWVIALFGGYMGWPNYWRFMGIFKIIRWRSSTGRAPVL